MDAVRIAVVETDAQSGLLHYAVPLADGLAGRGHEIDVLAPRGNELRRHAGAAAMRAVLASNRCSIEPRSRPTYLARPAVIAWRLGCACCSRRGADATVRGNFYRATS